MKKNVPKLQEVAEFLRNAAYADNQKHGIEWSIRVLHPRTDWGVTNFACGIWHSRLNRKDLNTDVSISFSYDESKGFYHFGLWVDGAKTEMPFGDTPTFDELKDTIIKKFNLKKLYS
jgi:hypothetical protein